MDTAQLPIIDLTNAYGPNRNLVAKELVDAAIEHGFVYIKNTGHEIPVQDTLRAFDIARKLFALPVEDKKKCSIAENNRGWSGMGVETLDPDHQKAGDPKEAFNFGEFIDGKPQQPIPAAILADAPEIASYFESCYQLALTLNDLLGVGLEVNPPDFFTVAHRKSAGPSGSTLRFLHYPAARSGNSTGIRAGAHSDYGSLTLLFRLTGQAGLEIQTRDGAWVPVPVTPPGTEDDPAPPILVNIGDLLSYWTGGLLRSTIHRVAFPPDKSNETAESSVDPRYSMAFFCHPAGSVPLTPVPSERVARAVAQREGVTSGSALLTADDHLQMRLRATYLDLYK